MIIKKYIVLSIVFIAIFQSLGGQSLQEQLLQKGYAEMYDQRHSAIMFDKLYQQFDVFIEFLQTNPFWLQNFCKAKEGFLRSKDKHIYSTDAFGFYDESKKIERSQVSFYYSIHFHEYICAHYPDINQIPELIHFLQTCYEIQRPYEDLFKQAAAELGLSDIFALHDGNPPIILKVIVYLSSYSPTKPHYDGTALTLFVDSTDTQALFLAPYQSSLTIDDFYAPERKFSRQDIQRSILLIPGTFLTEFSLYPTPHIVMQSGHVRYATIAFAMRPYYVFEKYPFFELPDFKG